MEGYTLGKVEGKFAEIIWDNEPLSTLELVKQSEDKLGWKRTTTYTVLKKLSERGIFQNLNGKVSALISKQEFYARQSEQYVEQSFGGSLPGFLTAFISRKKLNKKEIDELKAIIERE